MIKKTKSNQTSEKPQVTSDLIQRLDRLEKRMNIVSEKSSSGGKAQMQPELLEKIDKLGK